MNKCPFKAYKKQLKAIKKDIKRQMKDQKKAREKADKAEKKSRKKSPLAGLEEATKNFTPEDWEKIRQDALKKIEERRKDEEDRKNLRGKYDPENIPCGKCVVCGGVVVEKAYMTIAGTVRYGGTNQAHRKHDGYYCKTCGLRYEKAPNPAMYDNLHQGRDSSPDPEGFVDHTPDTFDDPIVYEDKED